MENCEKYNKKFYLGLVLFWVGMLFAYFGKGLGFGDAIGVLIILMFTISGLYKILPYIRCLSQFKRRLK